MPNWRARAKCKDLSPIEADELFFPSTGGKGKRAKEFCEFCPVKRECADAGMLGHEEFGMWGTQRADDIRLVAENTDRVKKVAERHPEQLGSYIEWIPPEKKKKREYTETAEEELDLLENPLDFNPTSSYYQSEDEVLKSDSISA